MQPYAIIQMLGTLLEAAQWKPFTKRRVEIVNVNYGKMAVSADEREHP